MDVESGENFYDGDSDGENDEIVAEHVNPESEESSPEQVGL